MKLLQLSLLFLPVIINGPGSNSVSGSNDGVTVADLINKLEAHIEAKNKERYDTLLRTLYRQMRYSKLYDKEQKKRLAAVDLEQNKTTEMQDYIVDRLDRQDKYIKESRKASQCDAARLYSRLPYQFDSLGIKDCSANPHLLDIVEDGWITFQHRKSLRISFNRFWSDYKHGFGSKDDDFWLGLETLHKMTSTRKYELRVVLTYNGTSMYAHYSSFSITDEMDGYRLRLGRFVRGRAGDSLSIHKDMMFSTPDRDNDQWSGSCARKSLSGWWFNSCGSSNLNEGFGNGLPYWMEFLGTAYVSSSEMKMKETLNDED